MNSINGKVVLVTGSSVGIGKFIAKEFGQQGAKLVLTGRNEKNLSDTQRELNESGLASIIITGDITSEIFCKELIQKTVEHFGRLDVLINNAALADHESFEDMSPTVFRSIIDVNINAQACLSHHAIPELKRTKGSIVFLSSVAAFQGIPFSSAYSTSKMALTALSQSLRIELKRHHIHVGIVYIGFTKNLHDKKLLNGNGNGQPVPYRPEFVQQHPSKVARSIVNLVKYRRKKRVLSTVGKLTAGLNWIFPGLVLSLLARNHKKKIRKGINK